MAIFGIPYILPLLWALLITCYWWFKMKNPLNHWLVCLLVFCINFFWFAWAFVVFLIIAIFNSGILYKKNNEKDNQ